MRVAGLVRRGFRSVLIAATRPVRASCRARVSLDPSGRGLYAKDGSRRGWEKSGRVRVSLSRGVNHLPATMDLFIESVATFWRTGRLALKFEPRFRQRSPSRLSSLARRASGFTGGRLRKSVRHVPGACFALSIRIPRAVVFLDKRSPACGWGELVLTGLCFIQREGGFFTGFIGRFEPRGTRNVYYRGEVTKGAHPK